MNPRYLKPLHLSSYLLDTTLAVSSLRRSLPGQSLRQRFLLLGSVPLFGLCSAHLSRKPPRYRSLSSCPTTQALSYGLPGPSFSQYVGTRQRASRLADLRRFRSDSDCRRSRPLPRRTFRRGVVRDRVCPGLDDHRFVSVAFPVGKIPPPQERGETAYAAGSAGQHSDQCLCDRRPSPRREHSGPVASRSRSVLLARSRLCGLRSPVCLGPSLCLLRHAHQKEYAVLPSQLTSRRTIGRIAKRD